jgi:cobalt-zinc-cadmium efflux system outer membrane protein
VTHIFSDLIRRVGVLGALGALAFAPAAAQRPVTRAAAERAALSAGTRVALARADSAAALARLLTARALPNPTLAASYSKATPQKHITVEFPILDALYTRGARVGQATAAARASRLLFASERIAALVEVDTTYTRALAADARFRLSKQTALDADSLRRMTQSRRDAGDASDLDVDLATVVAGQQLNVAANDSLSYMSALLTVQTLMGIAVDSVSIVLADSLILVPADTMPARAAAAATGVPVAPPALATSQASGTGMTLGTGQIQTPGAGPIATASVAAAEATLQAAELGIALQRRSVFGLPALSLGLEFGDPTGSEPGLLPLIGIAVPLPLFSRNQGPIAEATAERERARVQLLAARLEVRQRLLEGMKEREALLVKIARDRDLVARADRVASRSLTAYREGASALPAVLEARRSAREVLGQYIDDLAALLTVNTELRALTQPVPVP